MIYQKVTTLIYVFSEGSCFVFLTLSSFVKALFSFYRALTSFKKIYLLNSKILDTKKPTPELIPESVLNLKLNGGPDRDRTGDLLRDRQAC